MGEGSTYIQPNMRWVAVCFLRPGNLHQYLMVEIRIKHEYTMTIDMTGDNIVYKLILYISYIAALVA